jgi:caa(3)-type oxidase subunit IV
MAEHAHAAESHGGYGEHTHHPNYVKIWAILLVLLVVSVAGPFVGIKIVTLLTAFGIAVVKAYLVAKNFMHINIAAKYVTYLVVTMLVFMFLFFAGSAPDVMKPEGRNWTKPSWLEGTAHPAPGGHEAPSH